jgi:N-acyl-D-amino-acid deacylase
MFDLVIRNGKLVDGTGAPARHADVGIKDGRITEVSDSGKIGAGKREINADGRVVAPGFIDPHTHYDAQICWDGELAPTSWHGFTTAIVGNCGVGIAPCRPDMHEVVLKDLVNVEGIPYDALTQGVKWQWETFPEFMAAADARGSGLNLGFYAPLTPFRHFVMGHDSIERGATPEETAKIKALLKDAVAKGAIGISTTRVPQHLGYGGKPIACQKAGFDEMRAYASALGELGKGAMTMALFRQTSVMADDERELLQILHDASHRPITFIGYLHRDDIPNAWRDSKAKLGDLGNRNVLAQITPLPLTRELTLKRPYIYAALPSWNKAIKGTLKDQWECYTDPGFRERFRADLKMNLSTAGRWENLKVVTAQKDSLKRFEGRTIADIAKELGKDGVDTLMDIALEDELNTDFSTAAYNANEKEVAEILNLPNTLVGLGDGGAHVDVNCDAGYTTYLLGHWVRERGIMSLETAVKKITSEPADFLGIKDRGRLAVGNAADIVVFDEATVGCAPKLEKANDLPGGIPRLIVRSKGVDFTIVNGQVAWQEGALTGTRAGKVLRT